MTARPDMDERLFDEALAWQGALEADDADWDGYTAWLEADPRHREAFDAVALTDRIVADHRYLLRDVLPVAADDPVPARRAPRRWLTGAAAAAVAVAVALPMLTTAAADMTYATGAAPRHVALAGGIVVDLGPRSTLIAKAGDTSRLELTGGEAYFDVAHDPARTLAIQAGRYSISDIGTRFGINLSAGRVLVGVADGQVTVDPLGAASPVPVAAGQQFSAPLGADGRASVRDIATGDIGSWRQGRLSYGNAPLDVVAADISRYLEKTVDVDPALADRRFSGVLTIGDGSRLLPTLAQVMGLSYTVKGDRVRLAAVPAR